eukprot:contig_14340_g3442
MDAAVTAGTAPPPHLVTPPSLPAGVPFFDVTVDIDGIDGNDDGDTSTGAGALGSAAADVARSPVGSAVGGDDQADAPGTGDDVEAEKAAAVKAAAKREKELKKAVKDYMKTALSSERTFFKWVWTGLNLGALGMFSLAFFEDHTPFPYRLLLTGAAWAAGLLAALYGLRQFHRRRAALLTATDDPSAWESPRAPAIVVAVFASMLGLMVVYAVASHQTFQVHSPTVVGGGGG